VQAARPRFRPSREEAAELVRAFMKASVSGDVEELTRLLAAGAVMHGDGGGKRKAGLNVIEGRDKIIRFLAKQMQKGRTSRYRAAKPVEIHGLPGFILTDEAGEIETLAFEIDAGRITAIYHVRNPEKLTHVAAS
jgi:RNA polymerase sigma-70 factor (ECF subfamily)